MSFVFVCFEENARGEKWCDTTYVYTNKLEKSVGIDLQASTCQKRIRLTSIFIQLCLKECLNYIMKFQKRDLFGYVLNKAK